MKSPCFDFSGLQHPRIRFKLFWETEKTYDGGSLQVSTNGGSSWIVIGTHLDTADCETQNWYNSNFINNLNSLSYPPMGWSGTVSYTHLDVYKRQCILSDWISLIADYLE